MADIIITRKGVDTFFEGITPKGTEWVLLALANDEQIMTEKELVVTVREIQKCHLIVDVVRK